MTPSQQKRKEIKLTITQAFTLVAHKIKEFADVENNNQKLWYETKNVVTSGMIIITVTQMLIIVLLVILLFRLS